MERTVWYQLGETLPFGLATAAHAGEKVEVESRHVNNYLNPEFQNDGIYHYDGYELPASGVASYMGEFERRSVVVSSGRDSADQVELSLAEPSVSELVEPSQESILDLSIPQLRKYLEQYIDDPVECLTNFAIRKTGSSDNILFGTTETFLVLGQVTVDGSNRGFRFDVERVSGEWGPVQWEEPNDEHECYTVQSAGFEEFLSWVDPDVLNFESVENIFTYSNDRPNYRMACPQYRPAWAEENGNFPVGGVCLDVERGLLYQMDVPFGATARLDQANR